MSPSLFAPKVLIVDTTPFYFNVTVSHSKKVHRPKRISVCWNATGASDEHYFCQKKGEHFSNLFFLLGHRPTVYCISLEGKLYLIHIEVPNRKVVAPLAWLISHDLWNHFTECFRIIFLMICLFPWRNDKVTSL